MRYAAGLYCAGLYREARDFLRSVEWFHGDAGGLMHYNLACCYCRMGRMAAARVCLALALAQDARWRCTAISDPDLSSLRFDLQPYAEN
jgi:tetratricopeptide (TPR) repeat protein